MLAVDRREVGGIHLVMCWVEGQMVRDYMACTKLSLQQVIDVARQFAIAIHYAHRADIVHRDLMPNSILIDADRKPHLADFGFRSTRPRSCHKNEANWHLWLIPPPLGGKFSTREAIASRIV